MKRSQIAVGNYTYPQYSFDYFLRSMNNLGVDTIELWCAEPHLYFEDFSIAQTIELAKKIKAHGLSVCCVTPEQCMYPINIAAKNPNTRRRSIDFFKRAVETAVIMEAPKALVTPGHYLWDHEREEAYGYCVESLQELARYAQEKGVVFAFEHLIDFPTALAQTSAEAKKMLDDVGCYGGIKGMVDVDMAAARQEGAREYLEAFGRDLVHVHFVDSHHDVPGAGTLPMTQYLEDLDAGGYEDHISLEVMSRARFEEPEKAIADSLAFFARYMDTHK